jgi:hypothetical protein
MRQRIQERFARSGGFRIKGIEAFFVIARTHERSRIELSSPWESRKLKVRRDAALRFQILISKTDRFCQQINSVLRAESIGSVPQPQCLLITCVWSPASLTSCEEDYSPGATPPYGVTSLARDALDRLSSAGSPVDASRVTPLPSRLRQPSVASRPNPRPLTRRAA